MYSGYTGSSGYSKTLGRPSGYGQHSSGSSGLRSTNERTGHYPTSSSSYNPITGSYRGVSSNLTKNYSGENTKSSNHSYLNKSKYDKEESKTSLHSSLVHNGKTLSSSSKLSGVGSTANYAGYGITKNSKPNQVNLMGGTLSQEEESKSIRTKQPYQQS